MVNPKEKECPPKGGRARVLNPETGKCIFVGEMVWKLRQARTHAEESDAANRKNQASPLPKKKLPGLIRQWKHLGWKYLSKLRTGQNLPGHELNRATRLNRALAQYMRTEAPRAPRMPPHSPRYSYPKMLYRGIYGSQAKAFKKNGFVDMKHYIAFSRNRWVGEKFALTNHDMKQHVLLLLYLPSGIPSGTPWLWFHKTEKNNNYGKQHALLKQNRIYDDFDVNEYEVLLPPGRLVAEKNQSIKQLLQNLGEDDERFHHYFNVYKVHYLPDIDAVSTFNKKPIVTRMQHFTPKAQKSRLNSWNAAQLPSYAQLWRLFNSNNAKKRMRQTENNNSRRTRTDK